MYAYTSLIALIALILFYCAWQEKSADNTRDAKLLGLCGALMALLAGGIGLSS